MGHLSAGRERLIAAGAADVVSRFLLGLDGSQLGALLRKNRG